MSRFWATLNPEIVSLFVQVVKELNNEMLNLIRLFGPFTNDMTHPSKDAPKKTQKAALKRAVEKAEVEAGGGEPSAKKPKGEPSASADMLPVPEGQGWKSCFTKHISF